MHVVLISQLLQKLCYNEGQTGRVLACRVTWVQFWDFLHGVGIAGFPDTWCVFGSVSLLADCWDRPIRKGMGNRNKKKRKIINLNQSQTTDHSPDGAGIY